MSPYTGSPPPAASCSPHPGLQGPCLPLTTSLYPKELSLLLLPHPGHVSWSHNPRFDMTFGKTKLGLLSGPSMSRCSSSSLVSRILTLLLRTPPTRYTSITGSLIRPGPHTAEGKGSGPQPQVLSSSGMFTEALHLSSLSPKP